MDKGDTLNDTARCWGLVSLIRQSPLSNNRGEVGPQNFVKTKKSVPGVLKRDGQAKGAGAPSVIHGQTEEVG